MNKTPGERLRAARLARGFATAAEAARHFGWSEVTYTSHENGTRGIRPNAARKYSVAFGISSADLLGIGRNTDVLDADSRVVVIGNAAWGVWRDMSVAEDGGGHSYIDVPKTNGSAAKRAIRIADDSVNRSIRADSIAIYRVLDPRELPRLEPGNLVVIRRSRGTLVELTVRRVTNVHEAVIKVSAYSTDARYRDVLEIPLFPQANDVEIIGQVVAKYAEV